MKNRTITLNAFLKRPIRQGSPPSMVFLLFVLLRNIFYFQKKPHINTMVLTRTLSFLAILCLPLFAFAATETFGTGSYIINMGVVPQTVSNGLKPYGLIYDLLKHDQVPVKWVISPTKVKDGADFIYNGVQYKGGTFIIPVEYRTASVNGKIISYGVTGTTTNSPLTVDVSYTLASAPTWTLDEQNGQIAAGFFVNSGVPSSAYNWKDPQLLDGCDDVFVMPHADPTWATHSNLYDWNRNHYGSIWGGCHAVSVLENMNNGTLQTNFLATNVGAAGNALVPFGQHSSASPPYTHQEPNAEGAQYMGITDGAHLNGSEQVFLPKLGGGWRPSTKIIAYDPTQSNIPALSAGPAAIIAFGRAFGNNSYGWVMYEAGHSINKGTAPDNIAAQRAFWDFSLMASVDKVPRLNSASVPSTMPSGSTAPVSVDAVSPVGESLNYTWTSSCGGGGFGNPSSNSTTYTAPSVFADTPCIIKCVITDVCGRQTFQTILTVIKPPPPPPASPIANNDAITVNACAVGVGASVNVLANDTDPNGTVITFTSLNQPSASPANAGTWTSAPNGNVTFTPNANFNGTATITYTITNAEAQTATGTISATVGTIGAHGCSSNEAYDVSDEGGITLENFVSQNGTGASLGETSLDDVDDLYASNGVDFVNMGTNSGNFIIMAIGSTAPLRAEDTIRLATPL